MMMNITGTVESGSEVSVDASAAIAADVVRTLSVRVAFVDIQRAFVYIWNRNKNRSDQRSQTFVENNAVVWWIKGNVLSVRESIGLIRKKTASLPEVNQSVLGLHATNRLNQTSRSSLIIDAESHNFSASINVRLNSLLSTAQEAPLDLHWFFVGIGYWIACCKINCNVMCFRFWIIVFSFLRYFVFQSRSF